MCYVLGHPRSLEEQNRRRQAFAEAIIQLLESPDPAQKVIGMVALLKAFETKLAPVEKQAARVDLNSALF